MQPAHLLPLAAVLQDARGVIDGTVMFADRQVWALMLVNLNHQVVVLQFQLLVSCKNNISLVKSNSFIWPVILNIVIILFEQLSSFALPQSLPLGKIWCLFSCWWFECECNLLQQCKVSSVLIWTLLSPFSPLSHRSPPNRQRTQ